MRKGSPCWYESAVIYEVHVRAFFDSNDDGVGDFQGLLEKLPYIQELGVNTVWLLPFYPSPLKDEGYDISEYMGVHPAYGSLNDFVRFLDAAHSLGIHVITELVLNHTSDQHPWFQKSRRAKPFTKWRDFYVWSDTTERYSKARVVFPDFERSNWAWDPMAKAYYWHRFFSHQPDLNYASPDVRRAIFEVVDFWLDLGVDGLRLDAAPFLFEREGTSCENLPETHAFLRELRAHVESNFKDRVLLAEANQEAAEAATYFGSGDECNMAFHFPLTLRLFQGAASESGLPIADALKTTPAIPKGCQWAIFLRNHDTLSLEMARPPARARMYRRYARRQNQRVNLGIKRRLAPLLGYDRKQIEAMNVLLLTLPGAPVIYYGDEIGMGDNCRLPDRSSVRTPMQWSPQRNAGFSRAPLERLYLPPVSSRMHGYGRVNVLAEESEASSLLNWTRRLIHVASSLPATRHGRLQILGSDNPQVIVFLRTSGRQNVLVAVSLSHRHESFHVDLSSFTGHILVDTLGGADDRHVLGGMMEFALPSHGYLVLRIDRIAPGFASYTHKEERND